MVCVGKSVKVLCKLGFFMNKSPFYALFKQMVE